jgi:hypothetical protein
VLITTDNSVVLDQLFVKSIASTVNNNTNDLRRKFVGRLSIRTLQELCVGAHKNVYIFFMRLTEEEEEEEELYYYCLDTIYFYNI